jgi:hypothetical protein
VTPVLFVALAVPVVFAGLVWRALRARRGRLAWALMALFGASGLLLVSFGGLYWLAVCWLLALAAATQTGLE